VETQDEYRTAAEGRESEATVGRWQGHPQTQAGGDARK